MAIANPEVEFHLNGFLEQCNEMLKEHYETKFPTLGIPSIKVYQGGKYYKVAKKDGSQNNESAWFFVSKEDGLIWKAASCQVFRVLVQPFLPLCYLVMTKLKQHVFHF